MSQDYECFCHKILNVVYECCRKIMSVFVTRLRVLQVYECFSMYDIVFADYMYVDEEQLLSRTIFLSQEKNCFHRLYFCRKIIIVVTQ